MYKPARTASFTQASSGEISRDCRELDQCSSVVVLSNTLTAANPKVSDEKHGGRKAARVVLLHAESGLAPHTASP